MVESEIEAVAEAVLEVEALAVTLALCDTVVVDESETVAVAEAVLVLEGEGVAVKLVDAVTLAVAD